MIDANQQRFRMLARENHFALEERRNTLEWNDAKHVLRFRSSRTVDELPVDRPRARELAGQTPVTFDAFGTWARIDETGRTIEASGVLPDPIKLFSLPAGEKVVDMAMNVDGVLYIIGRNPQDRSTIYCINRRGSKHEGKKGYTGYDDDRYDTEVVKTFHPENGGQPDRIVALPRGGALLLDRKRKLFSQVIGEPVRDQPKAVYPPRTPRPCADGPVPQQLVDRPELQLPEDLEAVAMASNPKGEIAVLMYPPEPEAPALVVLLADDKMSVSIPLDGAIAPFSIGWVDGRKWALVFEYRDVARGEFDDDALVTRLLDDHIIEPLDADHVLFNSRIRHKDQLRRRLVRLGLDEIETVMAIWREDRRRRRGAVVYPIPFSVPKEPIVTGAFNNEKLVERLVGEGILDMVDDGRVRFDPVIKEESFLRHRLEQLKIDEIETVLAVWQKAPLQPILPLGRRFPIHWGKYRSQKNKKLCNGLSQPVRYPSTDRKGNFLLRPLHPLSFPAYPTRAAVDTVRPLDSGEPNTVWHRLYLEAYLPAGTGVTVYLAAGEDRQTLKDDPEWAPHHFGAVPAKAGSPRGVWLRDASEVPFHSGLLYCRLKRNRAGVFTALVQRSGVAVRHLKGRYLNDKIELVGEGHANSEVAALRIYYPRFSYLDQYLPELYREIKFGEKANEEGPATGADFLQRFLGLFESLLPPLEDKVADAYMLTNPLSAPPEALDWLGRWIGVSEDWELSEPQKRFYVQWATELYRRRGTMRGLALALDIATGDGVRRGDIFLLEDFRLRRTFATILGADLSVEFDPLLMDEITSANSFVGETLFLGEEARKEFLALYSRELPTSAAEQEVIDNFYARLANRLTVLVRHDTGEEELGLIRRIVAMETPSQIEFRVVPASKPLLIGLYSLVGVDTYLQKEPERRAARVGCSFLGRYDFIKKLPVLDDRLEP